MTSVSSSLLELILLVAIPANKYILLRETSFCQEVIFPSVINNLLKLFVISGIVSIPVNLEPSPINSLALLVPVTLELTNDTSCAIILETSKLFVTVRLLLTVTLLTSNSVSVKLVSDKSVIAEFILVQITWPSFWTCNISPDAPFNVGNM